MEPAASFFDMIEATICSRVSRLSGTFDRDENIVGRRQIDVPAPDQTAAAGADDFLHLLDADIDPGQHFHGVGRAGRRGNRARGGLGNGEPVRRHDRDDDHRGAVARNAADAMLVDDDGSVQANFVPARAIA